MAGQLAEQVRLAAVMLDDGLDEEARVGQLLEVGHDPDALGVQAFLGQLGAGLFDRGTRSLGRGRRPRPEEHVLALSSGGHRQTAGNGPGACDS